MKFTRLKIYIRMTFFQNKVNKRGLPNSYPSFTYVFSVLSCFIACGSFHFMGYSPLFSSIKIFYRHASLCAVIFTFFALLNIFKGWPQSSLIIVAEQLPWCHLR